MKWEKFEIKKELIILCMVLILIISFFFDKYVYYFRDSNVFLNYFFYWITQLGNLFIVLIIGAILIYKSKWFKPFILSLAVSSLIGIIIKFIIQKPRPFEIEYFPFGLVDHSFPSLHAISAVVGLIFLDKVYPKLRWLWVIFGVLILFSRLYLGFHFFSDVIMGGIIAYIVSLVFINGIRNKA